MGKRKAFYFIYLNNDKHFEVDCLNFKNLIGLILFSASAKNWSDKYSKVDSSKKNDLTLFSLHETNLKINYSDIYFDTAYYNSDF